MRIDEENRHVEIGNTMIGPSFRRSHVNTEAKFLMLKEAFNSFEAVRISFRIDEGNFASRAAVERLGAVFGGTLRNERILPDGRKRNYCFYTIIDSEWPLVEKNLRQLLLSPNPNSRSSKDRSR